jgi:hypothetical protein
MTNANDLTQILGTVKERVDSYNAERQQLAASLREIIAQANQLLSQLGEPVAMLTGRKRGRPKGTGRGPGRPPGTTKAARKGPGRPKRRRRMSAEARAKIAAAQKARWARQRAEKK